MSSDEPDAGKDDLVSLLRLIPREVLVFRYVLYICPWFVAVGAVILVLIGLLNQVGADTWPPLIGGPLYVGALGVGLAILVVGPTWTLRWLRRNEML